jgi:hypothetical protein
MVAKYRVLMAQTRDPLRAHMLQEMIDRELAAIATMGRQMDGDAGQEMSLANRRRSPANG